MAGGDKALWSDLQTARPRYNGSFSPAPVSIPNAANTDLALTSNVSVGGLVVATPNITVPTAGEYEIGIVLRYASQATAAGVRVARFYVNGTDRGFFAIPTTTALNATNISVGGTSRLILAAGDVIKFQAFQTSGGALNIQFDSHCWIDRIVQ